MTSSHWQDYTVKAPTLALPVGTPLTLNPTVTLVLLCPANLDNLNLNNLDNLVSR